MTALVPSLSLHSMLLADLGAGEPTPTVFVIALDLLGTFVFALSGGLVAVRSRLDVVGVLVLASVTGLGGGFMRDVLMGAAPPAALEDWRYLAMPVAGALLTFFHHPRLSRMERLIDVFDAAGLGLFCVTGALIALNSGIGPAGAALLGVVTGVGGGLLRDILAARIPVILRRGELYAVPAAAGSSLAVLASHAGLPAASAVLAAGVCTGWRLLAMWRGWVAPTPVRGE